MVLEAFVDRIVLRLLRFFIMLQIIVQPSPQVANHLIINTVQRISKIKRFWTRCANVTALIPNL